MVTTQPRVQLALNVGNLDEAIEFYSRLFETQPAKVRGGYANFAIDSPPLKLVLFEAPEADERLNHIGVELPTPSEVSAASERLQSAGVATSSKETSECCYALQDKLWAHGPDGLSWELYTVLDDADGSCETSCLTFEPVAAATGGCC